MPNELGLSSLSELRLNAEEREKVAEIAGDIIAVQVYRELQRASESSKAASSGCNIIGNCSSSSKNALLGQQLTR